VVVVVALVMAVLPREGPMSEEAVDLDEAVGDAFYRSAWCEIDLVQFRANLACLTSLAGTKALLVVKANAYGHGLVRMAREAERAGIDALGVATTREADELIRAGVTVPVLIMCALDPREIDYCVAHGVHFLAWRNDHFDTAARAAERYGRRPLIHIEVDTGMSRSGVDSTDFEILLRSQLPRMRDGIVGLATHFHSADLGSTASAEHQLDEFLGCVAVAERLGLRPLLHTANSPGTIRIPPSRLAMVRLGIAAYGLPPSDATPLPAGVAPVLSWKAVVTNVKDIPAGRGVGYGWRHVASAKESVATLAIGYADGFQRFPVGVNTVLLGGVETPVLGSVFMDQCVVRIPPEATTDVGATAVLLGRQGDRKLTAETLADRWGTNNYDVVAGIRSRVPRRYLG
jgi:alanine racemase